ncbi:MAG: H-X9-DG-CTERM domain-containing protein [Planctomycetota bacterium]
MNASMKRLTLGQGLAALTAVSVMAVAAPPSLHQLRTRLQPVTCANNLRACHQAWNVYAAQYGGVWMAPWDNTLSGDSNAPSWTREWPYTMSVYVTGYALPDSENVYEPYEGWWGPDGRHGLPPTGGESVEDAPQLQCPTLAMRPPTNAWWHHITNYSYAIMGGHVDINTGQVGYTIRDYPVPNEMTHPATTVLLHDIGGTAAEGATNAWTRYDGNFFTIDPHDGKSNYLMCDGHVHLLAVEALNETMWMSRWVPETP